MALDTATRDQVRRLFRGGMEQAEICDRLELHPRVVREVLHSAGLTYAKSPKNPMNDYRLPYAEDDELTPRQRAERAVSEAKVFEATVDYDMTALDAERYLASSAAAIAKQKNVTLQQAKFIRTRARVFLERFVEETASS